MVVKEWLAGVMGKHTLAKKFKVSSPALLTRWRDEYEITGSIGSTHQKTYSPEFKLTVLNYLETHSQYETSRHFAVFPSTTIANWLRTYRIFGYNGLKPKPKGRPPTMGRKRIHPLTPEQQELADLKQENYQLKMENAVLKKLKALVDQRTEKNKRQ